MAIDPQKLFEFAIVSIDIQIKKYQKLVKIGIGPDAKMNAILVQRQVSDLLLQLDRLLKISEPSEKDMLQFAQLMKFYLDCEYIRGRAGWLLDENNIHNVEYERVTQQLKILDELCLEDTSKLAHPEILTEQQRQCLHDSHEIAYLILDIAIKLKENPERTDLGDVSHFGHGFSIMRKHVHLNGRYYNPEISKEMENRHQESEDFLNESDLEKTTDTLDRQSASTFFINDSEHLKNQLDIFLELYPSSELSKADFEFYQIGRTSNNQKSEQKSHGLIKLGLFALGGVIAVGTAAFTAYSVISGDDPSNTPTL